MIAGSSVPLCVTESQYDTMVSEGTILEDALYYVYEDEEEPVVPEESGTTGDINTDTGALSLANATVEEDVLVIEGATIDENGVLSFDYQETGNTETTTTEVSDDGTAIVSDSAVDETTGTLSLNNASVSEDGTLTI